MHNKPKPYSPNVQKLAMTDLAKQTIEVSQEFNKYIIFNQPIGTKFVTVLD